MTDDNSTAVYSAEVALGYTHALLTLILPHPPIHALCFHVLPRLPAVRANFFFVIVFESTRPLPMTHGGANQQ